jgi:hypothetical protein
MEKAYSPEMLANTGHFHMVPTPKSRIKIVIKKYYYLKSIVAATRVTTK